MSQISFKINGNTYYVDGRYGPDVSLNEYIRNVAGLTGTKFMCQEGGCGACIVAVRASFPPTYEKKLFSVNSCLVSVLSCHDWEVTTVEGVGNKVKGYHDIQTRFAKFNATQCGYCTPGWVVNMYSLTEDKDKKLSSKDIENSFASNICRCTGYRPIADALKSFAIDAEERLLNKIADVEDLSFIKACGVNCKDKCKHKKSGIEKSEQWCVLDKLQADKEMIVIDCVTHKWYKPYSLKDVFDAMANEEYKLIAGNTGQGIFHVTDYPKNVIDIFDVPELRGWVLDVNLVLGANTSLSEMMELFQKISRENEDFSYLMQMYDHLDLVAHVPVRNIGTIAGNLYLKHLNKGFQSDIFLIFETIGAMITIAEDNVKRTIMSLAEFLNIDMKRKLIFSILPPMSKSSVFKTYKIMPRSQNAHTVVNAAFYFEFELNTSVIRAAKINYGNITPNFSHASNTEALLIGRDLYTEETLNAALTSLDREIIPEENPTEPTPAYRKMLSLALFYKAIISLCPSDRINPRYKSGGDAIKRNISRGNQTFDTDNSIWPLNQPIPKIEALVQCSGEAKFCNDIPKEVNDVYGAFVTANVSPGSVIIGFDTTEAMKLPGVIAFYSAKNIPGENNFTPKTVPMIVDVEEVLCSGRVKFFGQAAGIIVADRQKTAIKAANLVNIKYSSVNTNKALISISDVLASPERSQRVRTDKTYQPEDRGNDTTAAINGTFSIGGQYHYYMELQTCVAKPTENGMDIYSAIQWLDLANVAIANFLKIPVNSVNVIIPRVGGAYGGKISRASQIACAASLVCHLQGKTCRFVLPLQTNMRMIGKRAPTRCEFEVGINNDGEIQSLRNVFYQDNGNSSNETMSPLTVEHFKNCYDARRWYIEGNSVLTDMPSNTYCRAPSSTEGVAMVEYIMEKIAFTLNKDSMQIRLLNIEKSNPLPELIEELKMNADYDLRKNEVQMFNDQNRWRKRGIKMLPLLYEVFFMSNFNSLVSIYHGDGSVSITHGGIEMGQGLNTKVAQVCAYSLGIPLEKISVKPSSSVTSPNAMVTGGSVGSESVSFATMKACEILTQRLEPIKAQNTSATWEELIQKAFAAGVDLQATFCLTGSNNNLQPYQVYAVCALEVEIDVLTGNHDVIRVDLLEDTGRSLSPEIDVGQIEGAFVMGLGYWTSEQLIYDNNTGQLLTDRTWTYKPPGIKDIPADMRIYFRRNGSNANGVLQSKATGEPAFCLATVITHAIREAVRSARLDAGYQDQWIDIENPNTVENIFNAVEHKIEHFKLN